MRAIRTSLIPSRATSLTAASRIRARALARAAALACTQRTLRHDSGRAGVDELLVPREVDAELGRITGDDVAPMKHEALARETEPQTAPRRAPTARAPPVS